MEQTFVEVVQRIMSSCSNLISGRKVEVNDLRNSSVGIDYTDDIIRIYSSLVNLASRRISVVD